MPRVGIKFCGGCNPSIDRTKVFQEIRDLASNISFAGLQEGDLSAFLFICGCLTACPVEELGFYGHPKVVVVAGETVDGLAVPEGTIARVAAGKLRRLLPSKQAP